MSDDERWFGEQFDASRFSDGQADDEVIKATIEEVFEARHVVPVEPDSPYNNFAEEKQIHHLIDYTGIDYLVDTFDSPLFGINHRTHSPSKLTLHFDIRVETGSKAPSELEKLRHAKRWDIVPKYATRMKQTDDGIEWFRIVRLEPFIEAIKDGLEPSKEWTDSDHEVKAWMYDYGKLRDRDMVVAELEP